MSTQAETIMSGPKGLWTKTARFIEAMENASGPMDSYGMSRCFSQTHPTSSQTGHGISSFLATAAWLSAVIDCDDPAFEDTEAISKIQRRNKAASRCCLASFQVMKWLPSLISPPVRRVVIEETGQLRVATAHEVSIVECPPLFKGQWPRVGHHNEKAARNIELDGAKFGPTSF
jgi:hypothetical protein